MTKFRGLGKGLDALLSASEVTSSDLKNGIVELELTKIKPGKFQPRRVFDEISLAELANSIKNNGVIQPLVVRKLGNDYEIIAGERRFRASKLAGLKQVPVVIRNFNDEETLAIALVENIQRKDLNVMEEAIGYSRLVDEFKLTHEKVANLTGHSRSYVSNTLRLLNLDQTVQDMLMSNKIDMGHARALLPLSKSIQVDFAQMVIKNGWTTANTEKKVADHLEQNKSKALNVAAKISISDSEITKLENKLSKKLGVSVTIKHLRGGDGKVLFKYKSLEQLSQMIKQL